MHVRTCGPWSGRRAWCDCGALLAQGRSGALPPWRYGGLNITHSANHTYGNSEGLSIPHGSNTITAIISNVIVIKRWTKLLNEQKNFLVELMISMDQSS